MDEARVCIAKAGAKDEVWWESGCKLQVSGWAARAGLIKELQKDFSSGSEPGWGVLEGEQSEK